MHLSTSYIEALIVPLTLNLFSLIFNVNGNYYGEGDENPLREKYNIMIYGNWVSKFEE